MPEQELDGLLLARSNPGAVRVRRQPRLTLDVIFAPLLPEPSAGDNAKSRAVQQPDSAPVARAESPTGATAPPKPKSAGDSYVVRPGDPLRGIARARLGADASPARMAREVDRIWKLNADRFRTGSPDLIMPGQKLRLR